MTVVWLIKFLVAPMSSKTVSSAFFFFFELEVYCPLRKQQDMIVQLSITSYIYHLVSQEEVDNGLSS